MVNGKDAAVDATLKLMEDLLKGTEEQRKKLNEAIALLKASKD